MTPRRRRRSATPRRSPARCRRPAPPARPAAHARRQTPRRCAAPQRHSIDISRIEGQVREISIKKVGEVVNAHPEEALAIIRTWLHQPV